MFSDRVLLITGGTGSFGNAVLRRFLASHLKEIRIFSRDEKKQEDQRKHYASDRLKFYVGDVRDPESILAAMRGVDYVFHAAALKQVPSCEFHPLEAVKTNILGAENTIEASIQCGVRRMICLSTDKAVYPINAMGMSKALMEKVMVAKSRSLHSAQMVVSGTRYGNVMASRGSVIPLFAGQILEGKPITITDPQMTRFMMTLEDAVDLVLFAFENGNNGDIFVQKSPATTLTILGRALCELMGKPDHPVNIIGTRHGEKRHEILLSREERAATEDMGKYFRIPPDLRDLNYSKFFDEGEERISESVDYTSQNTRQLDVDEMKALLLKVSYVQDLISGRLAEVVD
jgi:UDP-N-acetylglucosamine 4,6-dehydratase/5-epimerase